MIGKIFGNRYELKELIGEGGMALVYKAECSLLCRTVAVKILRPQYVSDVEFVERFRLEARAAASLSHPNIVNVYDVGQEDGIYYIVMEYVAGDNLKNIIRREAPFSTRRALDYTKQIGEALNHAHQNNIIHRDIKPHNILVTRTGQIKVTDFGIARAISESSFTQAGMVVGSVQYASPEQVRGGVVGPQSDIYSLGCVLYEMLTGRVPYKGDTSISIAMQHLQEEMPPVRDIRPDISASVERIINKALDKDLSRRYPSALALIKDIEAPREGVIKNVKLMEDDLPTQRWQTPDLNELEELDEIEKIKQEKPPKSWIRVWFPRFLIFLVIGFSMTLLFLNLLEHNNEEVIVPQLVGEDYNQAQRMAKELKLKLKQVNQLYSTEYEANQIISQRPAAGNKKRPNTVVEVVISKGSRLIKVPNLVGKTQLEAELALEEARLQLKEVVSGVSDEYPKGVVIKQQPKLETEVSEGAEVTITVNGADDEDMVKVPNFIGRPLAEVRVELNDLGLIFNRATPSVNSLYGEGIVIDQRPAPYTMVSLGTAMNFIVSSGSN